MRRKAFCISIVAAAVFLPPLIFAGITQPIGILYLNEKTFLPTMVVHPVLIVFVLWVCWMERKDS